MNLTISSRMRLAVIAALCLVAVTKTATGQLSTEQYIPIGTSPGVSGESSFIGRIVSVDPASRELTVEDASGQHTVTATMETRIWLDRSASGRASTEGSYADCEVGRRTEVLPRRDDPGVAAWIKIEAQ